MILGNVIQSSRIDKDALAHLSAAGITRTHISYPLWVRALNNLCRDLKRIGLWNNMRVIYPFVGGGPGLALPHTINLRSPGTFNATFSGGAHNTYGWLLASGNAGRITNFVPNTHLTASPVITFGIYTPTTTDTAGHIMGCSAGIASPAGNLPSIAIAVTSGGGGYAIRAHSSNNATNGDPGSVIGITKQPGLVCGTRYAGSLYAAHLNGQFIASTNTIVPIGTSYQIGLGYRVTTPGNMGDSNWGSLGGGGVLSFVFVFDGAMDDTQHLNFYNAVQAFQTLMGRQV